MIDVITTMIWMALWVSFLIVCAFGLLHLFHVLYTKEKDGNNKR